LYCVHIGVTEKALGKIDSLRDGREITYSEKKDLDFHCCEACAKAFNDNADNGMKLKILPGYENEPCGMFGCTVKGVAHKYRVYTDGAFNIVACFDHGIARAIWHFHGPQKGVLYIGCFKNDRPFCMTTDEKGWTVEIVNDDPSDKTMYAYRSRLKVLSPEQNIEKAQNQHKREAEEQCKREAEEYETSVRKEENRKYQKRKADQQLAEQRKDEAYVERCAASYKTGFLLYYCKDCNNEQNGKNGWALQPLSVARVSCTARTCDEKTCSESISSTTVKPYNPVPIFSDSDDEAEAEAEEPNIFDSAHKIMDSGPRLKLSTKRKADEEATDTEDDSDRDTKRIKKSNLTRMNADSEMYGLLRCNVEAREKKQEECGRVGDIDLLHLCQRCTQDAHKEKAFEVSCYPFPFDDNEYKYYACEREGCRTAEMGCGNLVTRA